MDLLSEQSDALGKILYLDEQNAVLMTYYRNNVLHIFALPALLASFFQSTSRMSREQILRYTRALYPYLQSELFIRWTLDELDAVVDQWLEAFVEQGLLRFEKDVYLRPAPSSRHFVLLTLLSQEHCPDPAAFLHDRFAAAQRRPERRSAPKSWKTSARPWPSACRSCMASTRRSFSTRACSATSSRPCSIRTCCAATQPAN